MKINFNPLQNNFKGRLIFEDYNKAEAIDTNQIKQLIAPSDNGPSIIRYRDEKTCEHKIKIFDIPLSTLYLYYLNASVKPEALIPMIEKALTVDEAQAHPDLKVIFEENPDMEKINSFKIENVKR